MSTLHVLTTATLPDSLRRSLGAGDGLLLSGDGVYAAVTGNLATQLAGVECAALACDVLARGLQAQWPAAVALIDHGGYVDLCVRHERSLGWS